VAGEVADGAFAVDETGFFFTWVAKTHELHGSALSVCLSVDGDRCWMTGTLAIALCCRRQQKERSADGSTRHDWEIAVCSKSPWGSKDKIDSSRGAMPASFAS
jgi:hypothetical protein